MAKLARDKSTGSWASRKVIPVDIREAYGKANEIKRLPGSLNQPEVKAEWRAWLDEIEGKIERLRQSVTGEPVHLSHRETLMFAGRWYDQQVKE